MVTLDKRRKNQMIVGYILFSPLWCAVAAVVFLFLWGYRPAEMTLCQDRFGDHYRATEPKPFEECIQANAKLFIEFDYGETKDLSKAFLTLLTALLVASITFSEKIVDLNRSTWWSRGLMIVCWVFILHAIGAAGSGLALMASAARWAARNPATSYSDIGEIATKLFVASGLLFGSGLAALFAAGLISQAERRRETAPSVAGPGPMLGEDF